MRVDALDDLAVQLHDHAQHAVRRRVLGPEVDGELPDLGFLAGPRRIEGRGFQGRQRVLPAHQSSVGAFAQVTETNSPIPRATNPNTVIRV
jgi:hypothetical protein